MYVCSFALNSSRPPPIEEIGFPNDVWKDIINLPRGLVLVTGVTGSGKSTTLASMSIRRT